MVERKPLRILVALLVIIFILCLPAFLLSSNLRWAVNSVGLFQYGFNKYEISEATGISDEDLLVATRQMIHYFNSNDELIQTTVLTPQGDALFNPREVDHLKDIKGLVGLCYHVQVGALGYIAAFIVGGFVWQRKRFLPLLLRGTVGGGILTIALLVAAGLAALVNFDWLFLWFHRLFFTSDTWMLNPATDYLMMMFPPGFFYDAALFIAGATIAEALVLGGIGGFFMLRRRTRG
jgi:integral membrane protein (TIGR01906 family)